MFHLFLHLFESLKIIFFHFCFVFHVAADVKNSKKKLSAQLEDRNHHQVLYYILYPWMNGIIVYLYACVRKSCTKFPHSSKYKRCTSTCILFVDYKTHTWKVCAGTNSPSLYYTLHSWKHEVLSLCDNISFPTERWKMRKKTRVGRNVVIIEPNKPHMIITEKSQSVAEMWLRYAQNRCHQFTFHHVLLSPKSCGGFYAVSAHDKDDQITYFVSYRLVHALTAHSWSVYFMWYFFVLFCSVFFFVFVL